MLGLNLGLNLGSAALRAGAGVPIAPTLGALTVSPNTATTGSAYSGTVSGRTSGSTLSLSGTGATGLSVNSSTGAITGTPTTAGDVNVIETLAGATNTPRTSNSVMTVSAVIPLRQVATMSMPPNTGVYSAQPSGAIKKVCRTRHYLTQGVTELRLVWGGYFMVTTAGEANHGNDQTIKASVEFPNAPGTKLKRLTFSASDTGTIVNGISEYISDPLVPSDFGWTTQFPDDEIWWLKDEREVPTSGAVVKGFSVPSPAITGEGCYYGATGATSQVDSTGALSTTGGWTSQNERFYPYAIIGKTLNPVVSVLLSGDSIMTGSNDGAGDGINGGGGFASRALASVNSKRMAWGKISVPGEGAQQLAASTKRAALYKYFTHMLCNNGGNDLGGARTPAQVIADLRTIWAAAKAAGVTRIEEVFVIPTRGSSTDAFATLANQTPAVNYATNSNTINSSVSGDVGTNLEGYIDLHTGILADSGEPAKWVVNGTASYATSDGTHPSANRHAAMATPLNARAATWTP